MVDIIQLQEQLEDQVEDLLKPMVGHIQEQLVHLVKVMLVEELLEYPIEEELEVVVLVLQEEPQQEEVIIL